MDKLFDPTQFASELESVRQEWRSWVKIITQDDCRQLIIDVPNVLIRTQVKVGNRAASQPELIYDYATRSSALKIRSMTVAVRYANGSKQEVVGGFYADFTIGDVCFTHEVTGYVGRFVDRRITFTTAEVAGIFWQKVAQGYAALLRTALLESVESQNAG